MVGMQEKIRELETHVQSLVNAVQYINTALQHASNALQPQETQGAAWDTSDH